MSTLRTDAGEPAVRPVDVREVRSQLRAVVLENRLPAGSLHSQSDLRALLDVGRTPFREALRMVQAEGLIEIGSNGQLKIPELSIDDYTQVQVARIALESVAVRLSVPELGPDDLAQLEGLMAQMSHYVSTDHFDRVERPHLEFHRRLVAGAGTALLDAITDLSDRAGRYRWAFSPAVQSQWTARTKQHRAILDAANAGDPEAVVAHLVRHYLASGHLLTDTMGLPDRPEGRKQFEEKVLSSLAPGLRSAVLALT